MTTHSEPASCGFTRHFDIVGEARDRVETPRIIEDRSPDVLLLDVLVPGTEFSALIETLHLLSPSVRIVVFSGEADDPELHALDSENVVGSVVKGSSADCLVAAVRAAASRHPAVDGSCIFARR